MAAGRAISAVATRRKMNLGRRFPWVETHGYRRIVATRRPRTSTATSGATKAANAIGRFHQPRPWVSRRGRECVPNTGPIPSPEPLSAAARRQIPRPPARPATRPPFPAREPPRAYRTRRRRCRHHRRRQVRQRQRCRRRGQRDRTGRGLRGIEHQRPARRDVQARPVGEGGGGGQDQRAGVDERPAGVGAGAAEDQGSVGAAHGQRLADAGNAAGRAEAQRPGAGPGLGHREVVVQDHRGIDLVRAVGDGNRRPVARIVEGQLVGAESFTV